MKALACIAAVAFFSASPALASGTILCTSTISPSSGPSLALSVGEGAASGIFQARFTLGDESYVTGQGTRPPAIIQSWIDRWQLKLEIADANAEGVITRLDTRRRAGSSYLGMLVHRGRTWRVRCSEEG